MLEARLSQGSVLKKITGVIKDLVHDGSWVCDKDGISMRTMDCNRVSLLTLHLPANGFFDNYICDHRCCLGINFATMFDILKCADDSDAITMKAKGGVIDYILHSQDRKKVTVFEMKSRTDCDDRLMDIPDTDYSCIVQMPTAELRRICQDLSRAGGKRVTISCSDEGITFFVTAEFGMGQIGITSDYIVKLRPEQVTIELSLDRLTGFLDASSQLASPQITLYMSNNSPINLEYGIKGTGYLRFYLAPIIQPI